MTKRMIKSRTSIDRVPEETMEEILINLPVKSVLRFKCVSKAWRCLVSSNDFVKAHLKKSTNHKLIYSCYDSNYLNRFRAHYRLTTICLKSLLESNDDEEEDYSTIITASDYQYPTGIKPSSIGFVGSCNGLILIAIDYAALLVWNPSTRQVKNIPLPSFPPLNFPPILLRLGLVHGFGYDHSTDDYKVVCLLNSVFYGYPGRTKIYSLRDNSWKDIENFKTGLYSGRNPKLLNGKLHWSAVKQLTVGGRETGKLFLLIWWRTSMSFWVFRNILRFTMRIGKAM